AQKIRASTARERESLMSASPDGANRSLQRFQAYLETLTFIQIDPRLRGKFGWSDIIQNTLLEASQTLERIEAMDSEDQKRWLRRMLFNNLKDEIDHWRTKGGLRGTQPAVPGAAGGERASG